MIQLLPVEKFKKIANELESNKHSKGIDSWTHLVTTLFCHLSNAASCRDISNGNVNSGQYKSPWMQTGSKQIVCIVHQQTQRSSIV